jgi:tRNA (Thr-GGU) A37 N-methylase
MNEKSNEKRTSLKEAVVELKELLDLSHLEVVDTTPHVDIRGIATEHADPHEAGHDNFTDEQQIFAIRQLGGC